MGAARKVNDSECGDSNDKSEACLVKGDDKVKQIQHEEEGSKKLVMMDENKKVVSFLFTS